MNKNFIYVLLVMKVGLLTWGILGFIEYFVPTVTFGLQESNFPAGVQFLHWLLISSTGIIFVFGYLTRWSYTPFVSIVMYATLATLCFVETVDFNAFGGGNRVGLIDALATFALFDDNPGRVNTLLSEFETVSPKLIHKTAQEYLRPENRTIITLVPGADAGEGE